MPSSINFYPRSPCGERLAAVVIGLDSLVISIHALLAESDELPDPHNAQRNKFLSTLSLRRATYVPGSAGAPLGYFYPRSPCGERPNASENERYKMIISIHALLAESDPFFHDALGVHRLFLSTLSLRRATAYRRGCRKVTKNFYPRSPCGERQIVSLLPRAGSRISIHALLAESDVDFQFFGYTVHNFYPRSPCGERLKALCDDMLDGMISIHALLAESDSTGTDTTTDDQNFYPRSPCGERQHHFRDFQARLYFYPRSPCGERLCPVNVAQVLDDFYPRSPCGERLAWVLPPRNASHFYPRSPCGERQRFQNPIKVEIVISIHALLAESDCHVGR